jgi:thioesterase domain-containing protein
MASLLSKRHEDGYSFEGSKMIAIRASGSLPPLFILGPHPLFRALILNLPEKLPVFGLNFPDPANLTMPFRIEDIAAQQVDALRRSRPEGPYALMGWCADGVLAYEMAQQLRAQGQEVSMVIMIDAFNPARWKYESHWVARMDRLKFHLRNLVRLRVKDWAGYSRDRFQTLLKRVRQWCWRGLYRLHLRAERRIAAPSRQSEQILTLAVQQYVPAPYDGRVMVVRAQARPSGTHADAADAWRSLVTNLQVVDVPGNHRDIFIAPNVQVMASAFTGVLDTSGRERNRSRAVSGQAFANQSSD